MKHFFWLSAAAYVFLYFYAAWIYEGFSMTLAIVIFVLVTAFFYWRHKRKLTASIDGKKMVDVKVQVAEYTQPLSLWRSPLPYIGIVALLIMFVVSQL
jgi:hypothetical protein